MLFYKPNKRKHLLCTFVSFTCMHKPTCLPAKIFRSIVVTDSDTVVCGSNMLLRLGKYTVDMTRTMARLGILFRQLTNMDTISSPSSDQQPSQYKYTLNTSQPGDSTFQWTTQRFENLHHCYLIWNQVHGQNSSIIGQVYTALMNVIV